MLKRLLSIEFIDVIENGILVIFWFFMATVINPKNLFKFLRNMLHVVFQVNSIKHIKNESLFTLNKCYFDIFLDNTYKSYKFESTVIINSTINYDKN